MTHKRTNTEGLLHSFASVGDRWALSPTALLPNRLLLEECWSILFDPNQLLQVQLVGGRTVVARFDADCSCLLFAEPVMPLPCQAIEWVSVSPLTFRLIEEPAPISPTVSSIEPDAHPPQQGFDLLRAPVCSWEQFRLAQQGMQFLTIAGFDDLISIPLLKEIDLYDHQLKTAKTVLHRFRGRALLCDEVGLGKTIEAGLITLELYLRKLCRNILILTPPSLATQWKSEMQRKFNLDFIGAFDTAFLETSNPWHAFDLIVASYHTAKREPHRSLIEARSWDLIIVDEAHHVRNRSALLWKFLSNLQKKYILLLTATPIQNSLEDLYNLITLLKPGLLSTHANFKKRFVDTKDRFKAKNIDQLHELVQETMIRNRRSSIGIQFTKRFAKTIRITPSTEEALFYQEFTAFAKQALTRTYNPISDISTISSMSILSLQRLLGSTPLAFLRNIEENPTEGYSSFALKAKQLPPCAKVMTFVEWAKNLSDQAVVFTQFRATQKILHTALKEKHILTTVFHGGMSRMDKELAIQTFRNGKAQVLLSTDSGSEGRNLQFCNILCNFDLPWNPMRIEQRIGRLSRIGQTRDVHVLNFITAGTIEEEILHLLEAKINLFELVMGEMDMILGHIEEEKDFEEQVLDFWQHTDTPKEFRDKMAAFGSQLLEAKKTYLENQAYEEALFGSKFSAST